MKPINRSTLAYANSNRSHEIYRDLFYSMVDKLLSNNRTHMLDFKNTLYSVDATTIDLCLSTFDWAHFRKAKGGIKLHVKLDMDRPYCVPTSMLFGAPFSNWLDNKLADVFDTNDFISS